MANLKLTDGRGASKFVKATGAGTDADPYIVATGATLTGGGDATAANQTTLNTEVGIVTETAPATDTASSGLNGRLQRIAQRLTSLIAQVPATLGQKAKSASMAVTLASDEDLLTYTGGVTETAPATDTASSGLNGRLQRIAQRLTSLIALIPASLGQKTMANSLAVTLASDQSTVGVTPAATEVHLGEVATADTVIELVFSLDTSAYAAGDVLADTQAITGAARVAQSSVILESFVLIDIDDQKQPLTVVFLSTNNSLGTENSASNINDTNGAKVVGWFKVLSSDYLDLGGISVACIRNIGLQMMTAAAATALYVGLISDGTGTYTASGLTGKFGFLR